MSRRKIILFNDASKPKKSRIKNWKNAPRRGAKNYNIAELSSYVTVEEYIPEQPLIGILFIVLGGQTGCFESESLENNSFFYHANPGYVLL